VTLVLPPSYRRDDDSPPPHDSPDYKSTRLRAPSRPFRLLRQTLTELMDRLGTTKNPVKQAITWLAEKASRVKLTGIGPGTSEELATFLALETLFVHEDVKDHAEIDEAVATAEVRKPELDLAKQIIASLEAPFDPQELRSEYRSMGGRISWRR